MATVYIIDDVPNELAGTNKSLFHNTTRNSTVYDLEYNTNSDYVIHLVGAFTYPSNVPTGIANPIHYKVAGNLVAYTFTDVALGSITSFYWAFGGAATTYRFDPNVAVTDSLYTFHNNDVLVGDGRDNDLHINHDSVSAIGDAGSDTFLVADVGVVSLLAGGAIDGSDPDEDDVDTVEFTGSGTVELYGVTNIDKVIFDGTDSTAIFFLAIEGTVSELPEDLEVVLANGVGSVIAVKVANDEAVDWSFADWTITGGATTLSIYTSNFNDRDDVVVTPNYGAFHSSVSTYGGDDSIKTAAGSDTIDAGAGDDTIDAGSGYNTILGGDGIDLVTYENAPGYGGTGIVVRVAVGLSQSDLVLVHLSAVAYDENVVYDVEIYRGSQLGDEFDGDVGDQTYQGLNGNDTFSGYLDYDTVDYSADYSPQFNSLHADAPDRGVIVNAGSVALDLSGGYPADLTTAGLAALVTIGGDGFASLDASRVRGSFEIDNDSDGVDNDIDAFDGIEEFIGSIKADFMLGGSAADIFRGNAGNDWLYGEGGADKLHGDAGDDHLFGGAGADTIEGGADDDTIGGGAGADVLDGGTGTNLLSYENELDYFGGGVRFYASGDGSGRVETYINPSQSWETDLYSNFAILRGTLQSDAFTGASYDEHFQGLAGDDSLDGGGGADTLEGGAGSDLFLGGAGSDSIDGGTNDDTAIMEGAWLDYTISFNAGTSTYTFVKGSDTDTLKNVEYVQLDTGTYAIEALLNVAPVAVDDTNFVFESSWNIPGTRHVTGNVLTGGLTGDTDTNKAALGDTITLTGMRTGKESAGGAMTVVSSSITKVGKYGTLTIHADGSYTYDLDNSDPDTQKLHDVVAHDYFTYTVTDAAGASDNATLDIQVAGTNDAPKITTKAGSGPTGTITIKEGQTTVTNVVVTDVDSTVTKAVGYTDGQFFTLKNGVLKFAAAPDFEVRSDFNHNNKYEIKIFAFDGGGGNDQLLTVIVENVVGNTVNGTGSANVLDKTHPGSGGKKATAEEDRIDGKGGADTINGGLGLDTLTGGSGADKFVFNTKLGAGNVDTIMDFVHGVDLIQLENSIYHGIGTALGATGFYAKAGATKAHDSSDRIIYNTTTGKLYIDDDGKGGHGAVLFATLATKPALDFHDFAMI